jgi:hypothetical protein
MADPTMSPIMRSTTKIAMKIKKSILAMPAATAEIPVNPKNPAMIDITKKNSAHFSIMSLR